MRLIHAFTEFNQNYPAYVNVSADGDAYRLITRSRGHNGMQSGSMDLTRAQLRELAENILADLGDEPKN